MRYLDDHAWTGDIVVVSHGAAIRLVGRVLGGVDGSFALEHHLGNTESRGAWRRSPTGGGVACTGAQLAPPFYPEPRGIPSRTRLQSADPMG